MTNSVLLYNDDAYKRVNKLVSEGLIVNHIITDPPYNISKDNNFSTMKNPRTGVDFGNWDRGKFDLFSWIPLYSQLLDKDGSIIIFCSYRFISYIVDVLESEEVNCCVKDILIWQKSNPMPRNINRRYVQDMEFAIWAVKKNAKWIFNKAKEKPYLRSLFSSAVVSGSEKLGHPTQKSLTIMKEIISIHSNENQIILDPFMGSGTTGEAALLLGRKFIGIEKEKKYFEICKRRLENFL
ncbi:MAG: site-specific DNA-methyltransferase [Treponema sp.]|nr:site-specific DNA-methyltransferase [Treponema sp.]